MGGVHGMPPPVGRPHQEPDAGAVIGEPETIDRDGMVRIPRSFHCHQPTCCCDWLDKVCPFGVEDKWVPADSKEANSYLDGPRSWVPEDGQLKVIAERVFGKVKT